MANFWDGGPDEEDLLYPQSESVNPTDSDAYRDPASTAPATPDLRALMNDPKASLADLGFQEPQVQAAPMQTQNVSPMAIGEGAQPMSAQAAPNLAQSMGISPDSKGFREQEENKLTDSAKHSVTRQFEKTPYDSRLALENAQGLVPPPLKDANGNIVYETDATGIPTDRPVYDLDHPVVDPNNPVVQQKATLADLAQQAAMRLKYANNNVDLSPLMAFADAEGGKNSHLAASYKPQLYSDAANAAQAQMDKIAEQKNAISKEVLQNMKAQQGGTLNDLLAQSLMQGNQAGIGMGRQFNPVTAVNAFMTQTRLESKPLLENDKQLQDVLTATNSGNPAEQKGVPLQIARLIEGARPAMAAAAMESGDPSLEQKIEARANQLINGRLTPENVAQYTQFIRDMQKINDTAKNSAMGRWRTSGHEMNLSDEAINGMIPQQWLHPYDSQTKSIMKASPKAQNIVKQVAPGSHGGDPGMDAWLQNKVQ